MPRWADDEDDWEGRDEDDAEPTVPCPYCQRAIHADTPRCPYCTQYISREDVPSRRKPWWIIIGALAAMYVVYRWVAR